MDHQVGTRRWVWEGDVSDIHFPPKLQSCTFKQHFRRPIKQELCVCLICLVKLTPFFAWRGGGETRPACLYADKLLVLNM